MSKTINNIHDKFVKQLLSNKEVAISFLEENLPKLLLQNIDLQSIEYENISFINASLKESFADIVLRFESKNTHIKICLFLEHKSYIELNVTFQLLEYLAFGYQTQLKSKLKLELIVPVIYYQGESKWIYKEIDSYFSEYEDS